MLRFPIDEQHEATAGSIAFERCAVSRASPKGTGEAEDVEGWPDDLEEDEDARLSDPCGTVS